ARDEQHAEQHPKHRRALAREHPERLDVAVERDLARREPVADGRDEDSVRDVARAPLEYGGYGDAPARGHDLVDQLRERTERADAAAVDPAPEYGRDHGEDRERVPREAVRER